MQKRSGTMDQQWREQFCFLANMSGVGAAYITLLLAAKSARDLEWLHGLLPANCRLPREQLITLKEFWRKWFTPRDQRASEERVEWAVNSQCGEENLTSWYAKILHNEMEESPWCKLGDCDGQQRVIFSSETHGTVGFRAEAFGCRVEIGFDRHGDQLGVILVFNHSQLTEELVNRLRSTTVKPRRPDFERRSLHCYYELPAEAAHEHLTPDQVGFMGCKYSVAKESFPAYMAGRLQAAGLDIKQIEEGPHPRPLSGT